MGSSPFRTGPVQIEDSFYFHQIPNTAFCDNKPPLSKVMINAIFPAIFAIL